MAPSRAVALVTLLALSSGCAPVTDGAPAAAPVAGAPQAAPIGPAPRGARGNPPAPPPVPPSAGSADQKVKVAISPPSPLTAKRAVAEAGIDAELARLVPVRHFHLQDTSVEVVALRTGVILADTVLSLEITDAAELDQRLGEIAEGLGAIGVAADVCASVADLRTRFARKELDRAGLLPALDALVARVVPPEGLSAQDRGAPLVQAGAWLATTHLVADAAVRGKKTAAADTLLHQAAIADFYLSFVRSGTQGRPPGDALLGIEGQLVALRDLASKAAFTDADVLAIRDKTAAMLGLL